MGLAGSGSESDDEVPSAVPLTLSRDKESELEDGNASKSAGQYKIAPYAPAEPPVPVTLITGYLGAGKSTLVNTILTANHGRRCAVLMNEYGESADVEKALIQDPESTEATQLSEWVQLENGCICCSVKNDMVLALESLLQQRRGSFDHILIETTGLADPGPVAAALWTDSEMEAGVCLDAIVTVVDARTAHLRLDEAERELAAEEARAGGEGTSGAAGDPQIRPEGAEAERQVACADVILLNKVDLMPDEESLNSVEDRLRSINGAAQIVRCTRCDVDLGLLLDTGLYSGGGSQASASRPTLERQAEAHHSHAPSDSHAPSNSEHAHNRAHHHRAPRSANAVSTLTLRLPTGPLALPAIQSWLDDLLWGERSAPAPDVLRVKGLLWIEGSERRSVLQGVYDLYECVQGPPWEAEERRESKIVVIGRRLDYDSLLSGAEGAYADRAARK
ncbi:CobW/HypB/UreG-like protein [Helicosporidium sp. ATCC 50920]|nr:CobW/HypB/UreG-like protein [Helicosporidium sp. ATCC 50920]|eukprot:KDD75610.1 CobW/HypB/UreG-like protein [Helicosporidium sp. ATCC 50920]